MRPAQPLGTAMRWILAVLLLAALVAVLRQLGGPPESAAWATPAGAAADTTAAEAADARRAGDPAADARRLADPAAAGPQAGGGAPALTPAQAAAVTQQQQAAQAAAVRAAQLPPLVAPVVQRPDYVSGVEWQVLQGLAARSDDPPRALDRLVGKLRFSKQLEAWRTGTDAGERRRLAARLLDELPARLQQGDYARADAERLQQELLLVLEPDGAARAARAEKERSRLGTALLQPAR